MAARRANWLAALYVLLWVLGLALLPWWLGLPVLLGLASAMALLPPRLEARHVRLIRHALRWGLAGWLVALQHALGGTVLAWGAALLGALAGYTLLAGLDAWLHRDLRRAPAAGASADWPELAQAPIGPPAAIIELQPPTWQAARGELPDPRGGAVACGAEGCRFAEGQHVDAPKTAAGFDQIAFSPEGRWFVACTPDQRVLVLWDRLRDRRHRLRGWQLRGWYREQPWLSRHEDAMPMAIYAGPAHDDKD